MRRGKKRRGRKRQAAVNQERGRLRENRRSRRGFAMAGSEKGHDTNVGRGGVGVETFVPPRRDTEQRRDDEREGEQRGKTKPA